MLQTFRDPRFDDLSGEYKPEIFESTYKFINDIKLREKEVREESEAEAGGCVVETVWLTMLDWKWKLWRRLSADHQEAAEKDEDEQPEEGETAVPPEEDGESQLSSCVCWH